MRTMCLSMIGTVPVSVAIRFTLFSDDCNLLIMGVTALIIFILLYTIFSSLGRLLKKG